MELMTMAEDQIWCGVPVASGLVVVAGEDFGGVAERAVEGEQRIGAQVGVGRKGRVIAVFADAGPAGEERPDGSAVVAGGVVLWMRGGEDAHAPVGVELGLASCWIIASAF
jgi:hypothetical protein